MIDVSSFTDMNVAAKESRFMHEKFHKSTNAIDISQKDNAFTDLTSTAAKPKILRKSTACQWAGTKRHTTPYIYTKGEFYPHPLRLYTQVPQSKKL